MSLPDCCWPPVVVDTDDVLNESDVPGADLTDALNALLALGPTGPVSSVFTRTGAVVAAAGDYGSTLITNQSGVAGTTVTAALNALAGQVTFAAVQAVLAAASSAVDFNGQAITGVASFDGVKLATNTGAGSLRVGETSMSTTPANNTAVGVGANTAITTGTDNVAVGQLTNNALQDGIRNVAIGTRALRLNVSGQHNIGVGFFALDKATSSANVAIGTFAGASLTTGASNTFVGDVIAALATTAHDNTGFGRNALAALTTGASNVASGSDSLSGVVTGSDNVAVGRGAGPSSDRSSNTSIGRSAGSNAASDGNIAIGANVSLIDPAVASQLNIGALIFGDLVNKKVRVGTVPAAGNIAAQTSALFVSQGGADTAPVQTWGVSGTNGGAIQVHVGTRNPNGLISQLSGSLYVQINGATSSLYINRSVGTGTAWSLVTAVP